MIFDHKEKNMHIENNTIKKLTYIIRFERVEGRNQMSGSGTQHFKISEFQNSNDCLLVIEEINLNDFNGKRFWRSRQSPARLTAKSVHCSQPMNVDVLTYIREQFAKPIGCLDPSANNPSAHDPNAHDQSAYVSDISKLKWKTFNTKRKGQKYVFFMLKEFRIRHYSIRIC